MISLLWTKSSLPLSKAIRWATGERSSHFAIVFDKRVVFHSNFKGVHIEWFHNFAKTNSVVYVIQMPEVGLEAEEKIYQKAIHLEGRGYDIPGMLYFGWRLCLLKFLGKPLPKNNKWGSACLDMCIEEAIILDPIIPALPNISMTTPDMLFQYISTYLNFKSGDQNGI